MRVAALYDIHGNLPALEAVLRDVRAASVDRVLVGGDVVCGPMSRDVLERLLALNVPIDFIAGNAEAAVLSEMDGTPTPFPESIREVVLWDAQQLSDYRDALANWPKTLTMRLDDGGDVLFCHATPRDDTEIFLRSTPEHVLLPIFDAARVPLVVCGHTHMQFDRMIGRTRVVNAGSVGMPFQEPGAYWLLLGPAIELRRTTYDLRAAADRIRATPYPQAEHFAMNHVLAPPTRRAMEEMFAAVALK